MAGAGIGQLFFCFTREQVIDQLFPLVRMGSALDQQRCIRNDEATQPALFLIGVDAFDRLPLSLTAVHVVSVRQCKFERTGSDLIITIQDQGGGMDLSKIPNPLAPENLLKTSGRGIFLMRSFMDVVEIRPTQSGTELKLIKHVRGTTAGGKEASQ